MLKKYIFLLVVLPFFISCNPSAILDEFYKLPENNRWFAADQKTFEFTITDDSASYDMTLKISHVYDFQFSNLPLKATIENPNGEKIIIPIDLKIKDPSGKQLADCSGDVCDLRQKIVEKQQLKKGLYKITITQEFKGPYIPNIIGIGLLVDQSH